MLLILYNHYWLIQMLWLREKLIHPPQKHKRINHSIYKWKTIKVERQPSKCTNDLLSATITYNWRRLHHSPRFKASLSILNSEYNNFLSPYHVLLIKGIRKDLFKSHMYHHPISPNWILKERIQIPISLSNFFLSKRKKLSYNCLNK